MFTGIVNGLGTVRRNFPYGEDLVLSIDTSVLGEDSICIGDSVAVNGVCLTAIDVKTEAVRFDVSKETLSRTLLGRLQPGERVNLELALLPTTRLGGHFVAGHVDGLGQLRVLDRAGRSVVLRFGVPRGLMRYVAEKGSVCIDGISLTVNEVYDEEFAVNIVPHTWLSTNMQFYRIGCEVHIEVDLVARYLESLSAGPKDDEEQGRITPEFLSDHGFLGPDEDA